MTGFTVQMKVICCGAIGVGLITGRQTTELKHPHGKQIRSAT